MRVLAISGSLQAGSSNTRLLETARDAAPPGVEVVMFRSVGNMPHFTANHDGSMDDAVQELRSGLALADAVLIATPEYAHALPGSLKNALDWIVGSGELYEKPVGVLSAAPSADRGGNAREMLERTLRAQGAVVVFSATVQFSSHERESLSDQTRLAARQALDDLIAHLA